MRKNGQQSLVFEEGKTGTHWYRGADEPSGIDRVETPFTTPPSDSSLLTNCKLGLYNFGIADGRPC